MCELFAMSARFPTTTSLSLAELARHGGGTGPHSDGWGVALFEGGDALVVREPDAANGSALLHFLNEHGDRTSTAIAHIRRATQGARLLRNTQPFVRELGGRTHVFAHNGMLRGIEADARFSASRFHVVGDTDSEQAFCALLERLAPLWINGVPPLAERLRVVTEVARDLGTLGPANFLYSDGDALFAHGHRRTHEGGTVRPPGLHVLCRTCRARADGVTVEEAEEQRVALLASVPLTAEGWEPIAEGEIVVLREGRIAIRSSGVVRLARPAPHEARSLQ